MTPEKPAPTKRLGELVSRYETSATRLRRRIKKLRRRLNEAFRTHRRMARAKGLYAVALTLSFSPLAGYSAGQIGPFLECVRKRLKRLGHKLPYTWVLERSEGGLVHYHLTFWLPRGVKLTEPELARWWKQGSTWIQACRSPFAWREYMCKTATKKHLPLSARSFDCGGFDADGKQAMFRASYPHWLARLLPGEVVARRVKGGWVQVDTGELFETPWIWSSCGMRLKRPDEFRWPPGVICAWRC